MKFLFVHQNFPGQFVHLVRYLAGLKCHQIVFITEPGSQVEIAGVQKILYQRPPSPNIHIERDIVDGLHRAQAVFGVAQVLNHMSFVPDIIIGHHGWGEMLNLRDVWPKAPMLGYMEYYYQLGGGDVGFDPEFPVDPSELPRIHIKNAINHRAMALEAAYQTPTEWQRSTYPEDFRKSLNVLQEGVDIDVCTPAPRRRRQVFEIGNLTVQPGDKLVTYVARNLEPYRGFHVFMRALPHLLRARKDIKVAIIGGDEVSYGAPPREDGTWREVMLREVSGLDPDRVAFPGRVTYETYLATLRRSDAHVYLTYPFVASWSLREALAIGCPIIGSDTPPVQEFIHHGETGILVPFFDPIAVAKGVIEVINDDTKSRTLREAARYYAERFLSLDDYLEQYTALIERISGMHPEAV